MEILWWLAPPVVVTLGAMVWASRVAREGYGEVSREVAAERMAVALKKDNPHAVRRTAPERARDRSTGIAVRPSRNGGAGPESRRSA